MNYGQRGRELLLELKRSDFLPPYNDENVKATVEEISLHFQELQNQVRHVSQQQQQQQEGDEGQRQQQGGVPMELRPSMMLHDISIKRNKRCLLAYHMYRLRKLRELRHFHVGSSFLPTNVRNVLSESEINFWTDFDSLVSDFSAKSQINLSQDLSPPHYMDDYIEVRVLREDIGRITTEFGGTVLLEKGTTHFLRRGDVEHLIRQGDVQQLTGEESG